MLWKPYADWLAEVLFCSRANFRAIFSAILRIFSAVIFRYKYALTQRAKTLRAL